MQESSPTQTFTLDHPQLQAAVAAAKDRFGRIRAKYPKLKGYLVLSIPGKQTGIGSSPQDILANLPVIVVDDDAKSALRELIRKPPPKDASKAEKERWSDQTQELSTHLRYHGDCRVEIRFDQLDYELIWRLQSDELVGTEPPSLTSVMPKPGNASASTSVR